MTYMYNGKAELEFLFTRTTENRLNPDILVLVRLMFVKMIKVVILSQLF